MDRWSLSSGAHSREPLARNDDSEISLWLKANSSAKTYNGVTR
jgi:hypothetical protein